MTKKSDTPVTKSTGKDTAPVAETTGASAKKPNSAVTNPPKTTVTADFGLNLRTGPHKQFEVLEVLPNGAAVTPLELPKGVTVKGWHLVDSGKNIGWVNAQYVKTEG